MGAIYLYHPDHVVWAPTGWFPAHKPATRAGLETSNALCLHVFRTITSHRVFTVTQYSVAASESGKLCSGRSQRNCMMHCILAGVLHITLQVDAESKEMLNLWLLYVCRRKTISCDGVDDGGRMREETTRRYFHIFLHDIREKYDPKYINRRPTTEALDKIKIQYQDSGFPSCFAALDWCRLKRKKCSFAHKEQYNSSSKRTFATRAAAGWCDRRL